MLPSPTERLVFRRWRDDDLPFATQLFGDPAITKLVGGPFSAEQIRARVDTELANERTHGIQYWPIETHAHTLLGCCGLKPRSADMHELGFYLLPHAWGQGYAVEAGRAVIDAAFGDPAIAGLFAGHHPDNVPSRRTLERLGFVYVFDEHYPPTGLLHPGYELRRS